MWRKKQEKKPKRKQAIEQVDDLLVQKFITPITLGEYFPPEFFNRGIVTSTHMVSCHKILEEEESGKVEENVFSAEPSKTKEDDEVVASLQCLPSLFNIHEMLQLLEETWIALIQIHRNPSLYATKIERAKWFWSNSKNFLTRITHSDPPIRISLGDWKLFKTMRTNFVYFGPTKLVKQNRKIMRTKYLLKLKILLVQSKK